MPVRCNTHEENALAPPELLPHRSDSLAGITALHAVELPASVHGGHHGLHGPEGQLAQPGMSRTKFPECARHLSTTRRSIQEPASNVVGEVRPSRPASSVGQTRAAPASASNVF